MHHEQNTGAAGEICPPTAAPPKCVLSDAAPCAAKCVPPRATLRAAKCALSRLSFFTSYPLLFKSR
eukprot:12404534-Karenia_brevis.AAC.1